MNDQDQSDSVLDRICIAMPCSMDWDSMQGNDEVRLCGGCNKNVYNISAMSKQRAEKILSNTEKPCLHIIRKQDGSIVTDECPNWLKPIRRTWKNCIGIAVSIFAVFTSTQNAKADQTSVSRDQNIMQVEPTVIDGHPYGWISAEHQKHKTPSAVPQFQTIDGIPIDPRHHKVPVGSKPWRDYYVKTSWPASIARIGITNEDLPKLDQTSAEEIFGYDDSVITLQPIDEKQLLTFVDSVAWKELEGARQLQAEACVHFAQNRMQQCKASCQESKKGYSKVLNQIDNGTHDPGFRQFVQSESFRVEILERQSDAYLKDSVKPNNEKNRRRK